MDATIRTATADDIDAIVAFGSAVVPHNTRPSSVTEPLTHSWRGGPENVYHLPFKQAASTSLPPRKARLSGCARPVN